ncbi:DNA recombination protein RmuC (plasmid) [Acinetobacter sp. ESL0695]|uniref:DNA recombination protein RmuC n=1 Tax=Acinetobacter sp. ESL0695 TaxID=2983215 RepID=UPI0023F27EAB|nr:DNA recombination protein RmuC [Acinetobacter sp. ESL0695]WEV50262.1 DNA recombination protein RmuC [Acinetobacter sp. ESL0695]
MEIVTLLLIAVTFAVLGFFVSKIMSNKKTIELTSEVKILNERNYELNNIKSHNEELKKKCHESSLIHERIQTKLNEREKVLENFIIETKDLKLTIANLSEERNKLDQERSVLSSKFENYENQNIELSGKLQKLETSFAEKSEDYVKVSNELSILQTSLAERERNFNEQISNFTLQKEDLKNEFKSLANDILDAKSISLQETSKIGISAVINPFQQAIDTFKKEVQDIHHRETQQQGELKQELLQLKELNKAITKEAHDLANALKGGKKTQGNWGELILENVLERSGLQPNKDFKREVSVSGETGRLRPDAIVYLPQGKHLIIDAKVSLNDYTIYINSDNESEKQIALSNHVKAVSARINELSSKEYHAIKEFNSPELVFMFIPIESAFVDALKKDDTIFQKALEKNILVATPTTLLTSLNIVRQLWRFEDRNKHTAALANKANDVFQKLRNFLESFKEIKKHLDKANDVYQKSENQLVSGRGNLVKQVNDFKMLAPSIQGELPTDLVEKANLEIGYGSNTDQ